MNMYSLPFASGEFSRSSFRKRWQAALIVLLLSLTAGAQEICNNGIDDDSDGLIDLNDVADCICNSVEEITSLIPNPSFESYDCLPMTFSMLDCATTWEQATYGTSDFFLNVEGGFWDPAIPMPVPDGDGIGGFIISNQLPIFPSTDTTLYNEYIGGCLLNPMLAGENYTLQMDLAGSSWDGFNSQGVYYGDVDITIFGSPACPLWPIVVDTTLMDYGCPLSVEGWIELGHVNYSADGNWQTVTIEFTPGVDIEAIMIGGPCDIPDDFSLDFTLITCYPYFWVDNLLLNTSASFSTITTTGGICTDDLVLVNNADDTEEEIVGYQWYAEGVAIDGQTDSTLALSTLNLTPGTYQCVTFLDNSTCNTADINVLPPAAVFPTLEADPVVGCLPLTASFSNTTPGQTTACVWNFGDGESSTACEPEHTYTEPGIYDVSLTVTSAQGCVFDTTYTQLIEVFGPPAISFTAAPQPAYITNTDISFFPDGSDLVNSWVWNFGEIAPADSSENPVVVFPPVPGNYPVELVVVDENGCSNSISGFVVILNEGFVNMPNIFTPNGDGDNERFRPLDTFVGDWTLTIFNRWGEAIFTTDDIQSGWPGDDATGGTYYWQLVPRANQRGENQSGYVLLVR